MLRGGHLDDKVGRAMKGVLDARIDIARVHLEAAKLEILALRAAGVLTAGATPAPGDEHHEILDELRA